MGEGGKDRGQETLEPRDNDFSLGSSVYLPSNQEQIAQALWTTAA